jgi:hypothetical protein
VYKYSKIEVITNSHTFPNTTDEQCPDGTTIDFKYSSAEFEALADDTPLFDSLLEGQPVGIQRLVLSSNR